MSKNKLDQLLELQDALNGTINQLADAMRQQVDSLVDIKLLEMWFRDEETNDIEEIEENLFETQMLYEELKLEDARIVTLKNRIDFLTQKIENL